MEPFSVIDARKRRVTACHRGGCGAVLAARSRRTARKLFVANSSSDSVSVIDTRTDAVRRTIRVSGPEPRAVAIAGDKGVRHSVPREHSTRTRRSVSEKEGRDDGKEGRRNGHQRVARIDHRGSVLNPSPMSGSRRTDRSSIGIPATDPPAIPFQTAAFRTSSAASSSRETRAYLPNIGASPNGPFRFNVNVQAFLSVFDTTTDADSGQSINMNRGVQFETARRRLSHESAGDRLQAPGCRGFAASLAGATVLVRVVLADDGTPTINAPTGAGDVRETRHPHRSRR